MVPSLGRKSCVSTNVDECAWIFSAVFYSLIYFTPVVTTELDPFFTPWLDKDLINMCRKKNEMHRKLDRSKLNKVREYESLRNEFKKFHRMKYQEM